MIKRLPLSSSELRVVLELNLAEVRSVAWNPAPRIICAVDRPRLCLISDRRIGDDRLGRPDDDVFLFFEPLEEVENKPGLNGAPEYLDMFKELLEVRPPSHLVYRSFLLTIMPTRASLSSTSIMLRGLGVTLLGRSCAYPALRGRSLSRMWRASLHRFAYPVTMTGCCGTTSSTSQRPSASAPLHHCRPRLPLHQRWSFMTRR